MPAFLETLSKEIYTKYKDQLGDVCIVLPNRRAILYIKHYLANLVEKTTFLPEFYSIEDFISSASGYIITESLQDQFALYALHREIEGENARSIEDFLPYASWMLSDFNEIDMYLVDKDQLYTYLSDTKAMALWNTDGKPLSDFEKQYLSFFRSIQLYYDGLIEANASRKMAHQGFAFRQLAENIDKTTLRWKRIIFAGFNALTPSEEKITTHLIKEGLAEVFWDADEYYLNDPQQEAGHFMRRYFGKLFPEETRWINRNFSEAKEIIVTGVPGNTGQIKYAGEIIQQRCSETAGLDNTALVLNDESLLLPMLNSIPQEAGPFNVTMGLSLRHTPLYSLIDQIISMHRNAGIFDELRKNPRPAFYAKDLLRLIGHPWMRIMLSRENIESNAIDAKVRKGNRIFFPLNHIIDILSSVGNNYLVDILKAEDSPMGMIQFLEQLLAKLKNTFIGIRKDDEEGFDVELEYIFRFTGLFTRLKELAEMYQTIGSLRTLQMIFRQLAQQEKIAFRGEPLQGMQVMGMLETRTLDFETVIMLSVNEGTLPSSHMPNSFVPYDIKQEFGLPTHQQNNAVFAYHFYRLLQRAKKVYLLYNTQADVLGGGEKSRFITQLIHEAPRYNARIRIREYLLSIPPPSGARDDSIIVKKDTDVMEKLRKEAGHGFHPSSLSLYINCPLQFYFTRLAGIREAEDLEETIDAKTLGTVTHDTLNVLFRSFKGNRLDKRSLQEAAGLISQELRRQFAKHYHSDDISHGKNFLVVNVAQKMLEQVMEKEIEWLEDGEDLIIEGLEEPLFIREDITGLGPIAFRGTADRIDRKGGRIRILDYKTGGVDTSKLRPKKWESVFGDPQYRQAFQLMMYSWLFHKRNNSGEYPEAGIISLRSPGSGPEMFTPPLSKAIQQGSMEEFQTWLFELLIEIFDPEIPFVQTADEERCKYCTFREMCNRIGPEDNY